MVVYQESLGTKSAPGRQDPYNKIAHTAIGHRWFTRLHMYGIPAMSRRVFDPSASYTIRDQVDFSSSSGEGTALQCRGRTGSLSMVAWPSTEEWSCQEVGWCDEGSYKWKQPALVGNFCDQWYHMDYCVEGRYSS